MSYYREWVGVYEPDAKKTRPYAVAIAPFMNDENEEMREFIVGEIKKVHGEIRVIKVSQAPPIGDLSYLQTQPSREKADRILRASGADLIVWGNVRKMAGWHQPQIRFAVSKTFDYTAGGMIIDRYTVKEFTMPPEFWRYTGDLLYLVVLAEASRYNRNRYHVPDLYSFIGPIRSVANRFVQENDDPDPNMWSSNDHWALLKILGDCLQSLGRQTKNSETLKESIESYKLALDDVPREKLPQQWAMTLNNLGIALSILGEQESETASLLQTVEAYRNALKVWTRDQWPLYWAMTQNNLGTAFC